ncbi:MAG: PAS domain S-box protein [Bacteroidota bacterium]
MFKNISIGTKITTLMFLVVVLSLVAAGFIFFSFSKNSIQANFKNNLSSIAALRANKINTQFVVISDGLESIRQSNIISEQLNLLTTYQSDTIVDQDSLRSVVNMTLQKVTEPLQNLKGLSRILIADEDYVVRYSSISEFSNGDPFTFPEDDIIASTEETKFTNPFTDDAGTSIYGFRALNNGGVAVSKIDLNPYVMILEDTIGLTKTGEMVLGKVDGNKITFLNSPRFDTAGVLSRGIILGSGVAKPMQYALKGESGSGVDQDYRGVNTVAVWHYLPDIKWGLVAKVDEQEVFEESKALLRNFSITALLIVVLTTIAAYIFSGYLIKPLLSLKSTLQLLGNGILPKEVNKTTNDEIGQMALTMNNLVQGLRRTADFANRIGKGEFETDFKPMSEDDTLGQALMDMKENIQEAELRDKERNWIVTGVAEIGDILRKHDTINELGDEVIAYITNKIEAIQGAFYVLNDDDENDHFLEIKASYAYNKKKYLKGRYKFAEGLVGQAAIEQDTVLRTEIPEDYVSVTSGILGDQKPSCILIVPLMSDEKVFGAIEFAGFHRFDKSQIKFVEEVSVIIARTIFNIKVNERTKRHLEESRKLSDELQIQQNELRQNAEEMAATQEELKRTNQRLEDQVEEVNRTQKRMQLLLENASEVISIFEKDGTVRYISPSVESILGYSQNEMIGLKDSIHVQEDYKETYAHMFDDLIENPADPVTIQFEYLQKNGETIWLEATGRNLLSDPSIQGILVNSTDITQRRRAEQEERMRSKMQSLSENSPDLITRLDLEGKFFYTNPVIETYTGKKPVELLHQTLTEAEIDQALVDQWSKILKEVEDTNSKADMEMDFNSQIGERVMQVNAIPEYDEEEALESVLLVSHDITERKLIELEIQTKNKKISESINYAKRIQGAILPNSSIIKRVLPESFIFYKAKDVVSGDFPWYMQVENDIFIAAVDCTGHGVPGALISLIGYFLLNDIVRSRRISDPGEILDLLDEGVTQTLRQDQEDSKTKDGMDIALCKINLDKQELEYAGAHRPLYYMQQDEMVEVKGNKFPIGGGIFKNQTNFTNTKIKLQKGDSVYFCSDGFPDQFGGPDNRKFGPKRLRTLIAEYHKKKNMEDIQDIISNEWENWKGEEKQTDDVLLIGIRF